MKDIDFKLWIATVMVIVAVPLGYLIGSSRTSEWKVPVKSELLTDLEYIEVQMDAMDGKLDLIDSLLQAKSSTAGVTTKTE